MKSDQINIPFEKALTNQAIKREKDRIRDELKSMLTKIPKSHANWSWNRSVEFKQVCERATMVAYRKVATLAELMRHYSRCIEFYGGRK